MSQLAENQRKSGLENINPSVKRKIKVKKIFIQYFGPTEKKPIDLLASIRDYLCQGLASWAIRHRITPKKITLLSFLIQLIFFPLLFAMKLWTYAFLVLLLHVLLDGFDGSVARTKKDESNSGALADILNDTTGLVIVGLSIIFFGDVHYPGLVAAYIALHLYHTAFIIVLNYYQRSFTFVIHTKFIFFILVLLKYLFQFDLLPIFFIVSIVYMAIMCVFGMLRIFDALDYTEVSGETPEPEQAQSQEPVEINDHLVYGGK